MKALMMCMIVSVALMGCYSGKKKKNIKPSEVTGQAGEYLSKLFDIPHTWQYTGLIPGPDGTIERYDLTITKNENVSDGKYILVTTIHNPRNNKIKPSTSRGSLNTIRGCKVDEHATVYKLVDEIDDQIIYFKVTGNNSLQLLSDQFENPGKDNGFSYHISFIK